MASYSRADVEARLPLKEMMDRFTKERGLKSRFFNSVPNADKKNLAFQFTRLANGEQDSLPTGNATLDGIVDTWQDFVKTGNLSGESDLKPSNGNGNGQKPAQPPTGTQVRREQEAAAVPPVSHSVADSAKKVFDLIRANEVNPPANVGEAYGLLWDQLDPTVRQGPSQGVVVDTLANLATNDRERFNLVLNDLPDAVRGAILDSLEEHAEAAVNTALAESVRRIYHISIGQKYATKYFDYWNGQLKTTLEWMTRDDEIGVDPTDEQRTEAMRSVALAAYRVLAEGLLKEARSIDQPTTPSVLPKIPFDSIIERIPADQIMTVGRQWGRMSAEEQHDFVNGLDQETVGTTEPATAADMPEAPADESAASGDANSEDETKSEEQPRRGRRNG